MRTLTPVLAAVLLAAVPSAATITLAGAQTCTCPPSAGEAGPTVGPAAARIIADEAPPPLPEYDQPPLPGPGYVWTPGYWSWNNDDYYWVPGAWVEPPHPGLLWTPGYWAFANGAYLFHRGYWGPHVGFYGGVAYGYGYFGNGFEGGRWQGDRFFYNRAVNNFGSVHITNVYERPAPRIVERVSFNGGPEGLKARPTPEETAAAKERHMPPTVAQRRNMRAASRNEDAFVTNNHGKPPVAATQTPGDFKGAAVVPAKAAGGPIKARPLEEAPARAEPEKARPEGGKPQAEKSEARPETQKPELKGEKPEAQKPEAQNPGAQKSEAQKPEHRADKPEGQKPGAHQPGAQRSETQKPELKGEKPEAQKPEHRADKPEARHGKPKAEEARPNAKPERSEARPEPKAEQPKAEKPRAEAERPKPAAEPQHPKPEARRAGEAHPGCHPGEGHCPK